MTEMQKKMQELISQEELDRAFDAASLSCLNLRQQIVILRSHLHPE